MAVGEEVNVFTVSARSRVGDAAGALPPQQHSQWRHTGTDADMVVYVNIAGDRKRRDIVVAMKYIQSLDIYISVSQKGAVSTWTNKVT